MQINVFIVFYEATATARQVWRTPGQSEQVTVCGVPKEPATLGR